MSVAQEVHARALPLFQNSVCKSIVALVIGVFSFRVDVAISAYSKNSDDRPCKSAATKALVMSLHSATLPRTTPPAVTRPVDASHMSPRIEIQRDNYFRHEAPSFLLAWSHCVHLTAKLEPRFIKLIDSTYLSWDRNSGILKLRQNRELTLSCQIW